MLPESGKNSSRGVKLTEILAIRSGFPVTAALVQGDRGLAGTVGPMEQWTVIAWLLFGLYGQLSQCLRSRC